MQNIISTNKEWSSWCWPIFLMMDRILFNDALFVCLLVLTASFHFAGSKNQNANGSDTSNMSTHPSPATVKKLLSLFLPLCQPRPVQGCWLGPWNYFKTGRLDLIFLYVFVVHMQRRSVKVPMCVPTWRGLPTSLRERFWDQQRRRIEKEVEFGVSRFLFPLPGSQFVEYMCVTWATNPTTTTRPFLDGGRPTPFFNLNHAHRPLCRSDTMPVAHWRIISFWSWIFSD